MWDTLYDFVHVAISKSLLWYICATLKFLQSGLTPSGLFSIISAVKANNLRPLVSSTYVRIKIFPVI